MSDPTIRDPLRGIVPATPTRPVQRDPGKRRPRQPLRRPAPSIPGAPGDKPVPPGTHVDEYAGPAA